MACFTSILKFLAALFFVCSLVTAQSKSGSLIEEVTAEDVKRFLDPTRMISSVDYNFRANFLPADFRLFSHKVSSSWAINHWTAFWAEVPFLHSSGLTTDLPSGVGDVLVGWGAVTHEDLSSRITGSAVWLEASAPTGSAEKGTGVGAWLLAPGGGIALNPTDKFPIYIFGRYLHSLGALGGPGSDPGPNSETDVRVRSIQLNFQTVHIFPKGFFVSALPRFTFNLEQAFNLFALGVGVGRALNKNLAISGGYVHHLAGEETFNQAFSIRLSFLFGEEKTKRSAKDGP